MLCQVKKNYLLFHLPVCLSVCSLTSPCLDGSTFVVESSEVPDSVRRVSLFDEPSLVFPTETFVRSLNVGTMAIGDLRPPVLALERTEFLQLRGFLIRHHTRVLNERA